MPDVPSRSDHCSHTGAVEEGNRSSLVAAVDEHGHSRYAVRQDSIVPAFLGKVNQGSSLLTNPKIQTFQESLEGLHSHIVSSNQFRYRVTQWHFVYREEKVSGKWTWLSCLRGR